MSCAVASSRMVIQSHTGNDIPEAQLRTQSQALPNPPGGYHPINGTPHDATTALLRANGVPNASPIRPQTVGDLQANTATGAPAIAVINVPGGTHAVVVDGVTTNPDGSRTVHSRDPGTGTHNSQSEQAFNNSYTGWAHSTN